MSNVLRIPAVIVSDNAVRSTIFDSIVSYCRNNNYPEFCQTSLYLGENLFDKNGNDTFCGILYGGGCWSSKQAAHGYSYGDAYNELGQKITNAVMNINVDGHQYTLWLS